MGAEEVRVNMSRILVSISLFAFVSANAWTDVAEEDFTEEILARDTEPDIQFADADAESWKGLCQPGAKTKMDVTILVDGSWSIQESGWKASVKAAKKMASSFGDDARVAVSVFSYENEWITKGPFTTPAKAVAAVGRATFPQGSTNTADALTQTLSNIKKSGRKGAKQVVYVITDGMPTDVSATTKAAAEVRKVARLAFIPVGDDYLVNGFGDFPGMKAWASKPKAENVFYAKDFKKLETELQKAVVSTCKEDKPKKEEKVICHSQSKVPMDVSIVIDGSGSVQQAGWDYSVKAAKRMAGAFGAATRVSAAVFSTGFTWLTANPKAKKVPCPDTPGCSPDVKKHPYWCTKSGSPHYWQHNRKTCPKTCKTGAMCKTDDAFATPADAEKAIAGAKFPKGATATAGALDRVLSLIKTRGAKGATQVVYFITDGEPNSPNQKTAVSEATKAAAKLRKAARLIFIPVGKGAPVDRMKTWASKPASENVFYAKDFKALKHQLTKAVKSSCVDKAKAKESKTKAAEEKKAKDAEEKKTKAPERKSKAEEKKAKVEAEKLNKSREKDKTKEKAAEKKAKINNERKAKEKNSKVAVTRNSWTNWLNNWDQGVSYQTGGNQFLTGFGGLHHNGYEDRLFKVKVATIGTSQSASYWSGWVNNMDASFDFSCRSNYALVGLQSYHNNHYEDRRWKFKCASFRGVSVQHGGLTGYKNNMDQQLYSDCGGNNPIVGLASYHNNGYEDRRWRFRCGSIKPRL